MIRLRKGFAIVCVLMATAGGCRAQAAFGLREGDRVLFYGDSITEQRFYTSFVETYVVTRFPGMKISFINAGVGGDKVSGGKEGKIDLRLDRDVIANSPTVVTCMLGMNDGGYRTYDEGLFDLYSNGYKHIVEKLKSARPGIRLTLIEPSPYDDVTRPPKFEGGYNAVLIRYGQFVSELAQQSGASVADLNTPVVAMLQKATATDPDMAKKIGRDRVHTAPGAHLVMAEALLKAWNAPALVADVEIDASSNRAVHTDNAEVKSVTRSGDSIAWEELDKALPFPLELGDREFALAVQSSDFVNALDREPLKVTGLTSAHYALRIDGEAVGTFSREELAGGVNLAVLPTPMLKQAAQVQELTLKHGEVHQTRWRQVQIPMAGDNSPAVQKALEALDALEATIVQAQHEAAQPRPHRYELSPA